MATLLSIDESPLNQSLTNDVNLPSSGDLITALNVYFANSTWTSSVIQTAQKTSFLTGLVNTTDLALTNSTGGLLNGVDSGLNDLAGNDILLYTDTTNNNLVIGKTSGGTVMFALYLDATGSSTDLGATGADLWMVEFQPIQHNLDGASPNDIVSIHDLIYATVKNPISFNATRSPSGNNLFITYGDGTPASGEYGVVVTAVGASNTSAGESLSSGKTVKTSQAGAEFGGATFGVDSQMVDPPQNASSDPEALYFTFVKGINPDLTVPNLSPGEADVESNIQFQSLVGATKVTFQVVQLQPASTMATMEFSALVAQTSAPGATSAIGDDTPYTGNNYIDYQDNNSYVNITKVTIVHNGVTYVFEEGGTTSGGGLTLDFNPADHPESVIVKGLLSGDKITYETLTEHDRLEIVNVGNLNDANYNSAFDIGGLVIESGGTTSTLLNPIDIYDDGPTLTKAFDPDGAGGSATTEHLGNQAGQTATGDFGYNIGTDKHTAAYYTGGGSDFVDANTSLAGVQISLTGTVENSSNPNITNAVATLTSESLTSASFSFSFHYDSDPNTAGVQDATAGGTLVFDKDADTYTITLTDPIDGYSFDVLHTAELVAKQPTGNTGHPLIVAEQLTPNGDPDPFFVQFTANSVTNTIGFGFNGTGDGAPTVGDTTFTGSAHDLVTNTNEDWVSATQATNGVAGDTIQKGELLTLRFFEENILTDVNPGSPDGGTERLNPTATADGIVIKFDGIGNSEDLVVLLDLIDANGNKITRAVNVENSDLIRGNSNVPSPYSSEFTLDNNDALLIIEHNDYTDGSETYQIQGVQIMQSSNGLDGTAIDLNGATGAGGDSSTTSGLKVWDPTDNDVLKIVDIGFVQVSNATINASLDFAFNIADADNDPLGLQHIYVGVSDAYIV